MASGEEEPENERIKNMRQEFRDLKLIERKLQRSINTDKLRVGLGEYPLTEMSTEEVIDAAKRLKKKPLTLETYHNLQNALLQKEENIDAFLNVDNIIHSLVRDLSGNNPQVQLVAASCCCNIALGYSKTCKALAKHSISYLITELDSLNYPLVETCIWTIGNLVIGYHKVIDMLIAQGSIKHLVKLLNQCNEAIETAIIYTLVRCIFTGHYFIAVEDMEELAKTVVKREVKIEDNETAWLLALLSSQPILAGHLMKFVPAAIEYLHEMILDTDHNVIHITALIRLLGNLVNEPSGQVAGLLLNNSSFTVESLLSKLLMHSYRHVTKETLWLMGNIYNHNVPEIRSVFQEKLIGVSNLDFVIQLFSSAC